MHARIEPLINSLLQQKHEGFQSKNLTVDQVTLLTQSIEYMLEAK